VRLYPNSESAISNLHCTDCDGPLSQVNDAVGKFFGGRSMSGQDHGTALLVKVSHIAEHRSRIVGIEVAGRLVGQDNLRTVEQGSGYRSALLFAGAQLGRSVIGSVSQAKPLYEFMGLSPAVLIADGSTGQKHVFGDIQIGHQMKHLEDKADILCSESCSGSPALGIEILLFDGNCPAGRPAHGRDGHEQGGFSTAAGPTDDDELTFFDSQVNSVQRLDNASGGLVGLGDIFKANHVYSSLRVTAGSQATAIMAGIKLETAANSGA